MKQYKLSWWAQIWPVSWLCRCREREGVEVLKQEQLLHEKTKAYFAGIVQGLKDEVKNKEKELMLGRDAMFALRKSFPSVAVFNILLAKLDDLKDWAGLTETEAQMMRDLVKQLNLFGELTVGMESVVDREEAMMEYIDRNFDPVTGTYKDQTRRGGVGWGSKSPPADPHSDDVDDLAERMQAGVHTVKAGDIDPDVSSEPGVHFTEFDEERDDHADD